MSDKFLRPPSGDLSGLSDGTAELFVGSIAVANLDASRALKTNATRGIESSNLNISDVTNLSTELQVKDNLTFNENDTQSNPTAGQIKLYAKTDGTLYTRDETGTETAVGGGGVSLQAGYNNNPLIETTASIGALEIKESEGTASNTQLEIKNNSDNVVASINAEGAITGGAVNVTGQIIQTGTTDTFNMTSVNTTQRDNIPTPAVGSLVFNNQTETVDLYKSSGGTASVDVTFDVLVVGGGGAGGVALAGGRGAGGGGAGGYIYQQSIVRQSGTYNVSVGSGATAPASNSPAASGGNSTFDDITAEGGGGGAGTCITNEYPSSSGGSGGGGSDSLCWQGSDGIAGQGNAGGSNTVDTIGGFSPNGTAGSGGGGSGGTGGSIITNLVDDGGSGGAGTSNDITGAAYTYAQGGKGGNRATNNNGSNGINYGDGGAGADGGSGADNVGGAGANGVVIIRVPTTQTVNLSNLTFTSTVVSTDTVYTITSGDGTIEFVGGGSGPSWQQISSPSLQDAYDNGSRINLGTNNEVQIKNETGNPDTIPVLSVIDSTDNVVASINALGAITGSSINTDNINAQTGTVNITNNVNLQSNQIQGVSSETFVNSDTHANPPVNNSKLYFKTDDNLYRRNSAGGEFRLSNISLQDAFDNGNQISTDSNTLNLQSSAPAAGFPLLSIINNASNITTELRANGEIFCSSLLTQGQIRQIGITDTFNMTSVNTTQRDNIPTPAVGSLVFNNQTETVDLYKSSGGTASVDVTFDVLVVGGGGAGGFSSPGLRGSGGGGAGGYIYLQGEVRPSGTYNVIVGTGAITTAVNTTAAQGENSVFDNLTAIGGGGGAGSCTTNEYPSSSGGSGGGGSDTPCWQGSEGTTGQGNAGGSNTVDTIGGFSPNGTAGSGGGGSSTVGQDITGNSIETGGSGGAGTSNDITGLSYTYAQGGKGGNKNSVNNTPTDGAAGVNYGDGGNGGDGSLITNNPQTPGTGGAGANGVVIIRVPTTQTVNLSGLVFTSTVVSTDTVYTITSGDGTIEFVGGAAGPSWQQISSPSLQDAYDNGSRINLGTNNEVQIKNETGNPDTIPVLSIINSSDNITSELRANGDIFTTSSVLSTEVNMFQINTPSNPSTSRNKLYFKNDNELYKLDSAGNEEILATGSGVTLQSAFDNGNQIITDTNSLNLRSAAAASGFPLLSIINNAGNINAEIRANGDIFSTGSYINPTLTGVINAQSNINMNNNQLQNISVLTGNGGSIFTDALNVQSNNISNVNNMQLNSMSAVAAGTINMNANVEMSGFGIQNAGIVTLNSLSGTNPSGVIVNDNLVMTNRNITGLSSIQTANLVGYTGDILVGNTLNMQTQSISNTNLLSLNQLSGLSTNPIDVISNVNMSGNNLTSIGQADIGSLTINGLLTAGTINLQGIVNNIGSNIFVNSNLNLNGTSSIINVDQISINNFFSVGGVVQDTASTAYTTRYSDVGVNVGLIADGQIDVDPALPNNLDFLTTKIAGGGTATRIVTPGRYKVKVNSVVSMPSKGITMTLRIQKRNSDVDPWVTVAQNVVLPDTISAHEYSVNFFDISSSPAGTGFRATYSAVGDDFTIVSMSFELERKLQSA